MPRIARRGARTHAPIVFSCLAIVSSTFACSLAAELPDVNTRITGRPDGAAPVTPLPSTADASAQADAAIDAPIVPGDETPRVVPDGTPVASLELTAPAAGQDLPFAFGQVFAKGDVPAASKLVVLVADGQVVPLSRWDDGSVKHALVAGRATITAGQPTKITVATGTPQTLPAIGQAELVASTPSASVTYGAYGTVTLAAAIAAGGVSFAEHAGPAYAAFQVIGAFPNDPDLRAVFHVQLWHGGAKRIRVVVENGRAPTTGAAKSGAATITIGGQSRYSGNVSMPAGTRFDVVGFDGADPQIIPKHDVVYLRRSKLVPNYGWCTTPSSMLNGLDASYTPMDRMGWQQDMGATGYTEGIGLLPHWDAVYACTGDARAYAAILAQARGYGSYSIYYRNLATKRMPTLSDFPDARNNGEDMTGNGSNGNRWEVAHFPNAGYLPWLVTAERFYLEALEANAWTAWYSTSSTASGTARLYRSQTRARAWRYRTMAAAAAVVPDGEPFKADAKANILANLTHWKTSYADPNTPATGLGSTQDDKEPGMTGFQHSMFENLFLVASIGWSWDLELGFSANEKLVHAAVRDYFYRVPVGLTGRGPSGGEYCYRRAPGPYRMTIGTTSDLDSLYATWSQIYAASFSDTSVPCNDGLAIEEAYADDPSEDAFPQGNWGHLITALSFAKDHGANGAGDGYARVTGASNWASNSMHFNKWPQYGVKSRLP